MRWTFVAPAALLLAQVAAAQDPFEIHIYEYEPLKWREYSLEAHVNYGPQGTRSSDGMLLPTHNQVHLTMEPTFGFADSFSLGFMFLNAWEPGNSPEYAGWRILPHFYAPESWKLPFKLGFIAEFSFQNARYEENTGNMELRPVLDREFEHWEVVVNPAFERAFHGSGTLRGWTFEPEALIRRKREGFSPSVEYYGDIESINVKPRAQPEVHQLFLGGDWEFSEIFSMNLGAGFNLGPRGPGLVLKTRLEWDWRRGGNNRK